MVIQRVRSFKLLGVIIEDNLKWDNHVDSICKKASSRLYFLKVLKHSSVSAIDMLHFYKTAIIPVLEYACPAWHNSLTTEQSYRIEIESIRKRAIKIIFGPGDYSDICMKHNLPSLASRRTEICISFFKNSVIKENSSLHYLLPEPRGEETEKLRRFMPFIPQTTRTTRFQRSYIIYALNNYQDVL